jgi:hypothetical protein
MRSYPIPAGREFTSGKIIVPIWINDAISTIFESVPKPGFSCKGIHRRRTKTLMKNVAHPMDKLVFKVTPSARTVQGAFPILA